MSATIRPATEADSPTVTSIVRSCWTEYPGVVVDLDNELQELRTFATHYESLGGRAWVAELDYRVVGCLAATPDDEPDAWMLHKLNVLPAARRQGVASALIRNAELIADSLGVTRIVLWSDTRFVESHAMYAALGYVQLLTTRELDDLSNTVEYRFQKTL